MQILTIGDRTEDGSLVVRDEDRLCYQVVSASRGATGVRTISKALLAEWIDAVKKDPHAQGGELRERLCGKTEIDKFEYGYFATLKKMAEMALGKVPVVHEAMTESVYNALCKAGVQFWTYSPGEQASEWSVVRKDGVIALNYHEVGDFSKLGDKDAVVAAFQAAAGDNASHKNAATAVIDFRDVMKPGDYVFAKKGMSTYIGVGKVTGDYFHDADTQSEFRERRKIDWFKVETHELPDNKAALKTLTNVTDCREFVKKLLDAFGLTGAPPVEEPEFVGDRLGVALKAFARYRGDESWAAGYYETNKGTREYYAKLSAGIGALDAAKVEEMFLGVKDAKGNVVFQPMWSGSNGTGWSHIKKGLDEDPQATIGAIKKYHDDVSVVSAFTQKGFTRPSGFGDSVVSELLMKFHPDAAIKCGKKTIEVLKTLNLMTFKHDGSYDGWEYRQALGIATDIKLRMDEMGITRTLEDHEEADYITVNEFIAWCHDNKDLIEQETQEAKRMNDEKLMKEIDEPLTARTGKGLTFAAGNGNDLLMLRLMAALRAKPFVILAGHSGTGKSRLVRKLAYMTCNVDKLWDEKKGPQNFKMIQVKPNWHDSSDLLGYRSAIKDNKYIGSELVKFIFRAYTYPQTPFFLCLDEMNLAPVEQYFAEFLSAMESMKPANKDDAEGTGDFVSDPVIDLNVSDDAPNKDANLFELGCESKRAYQWVKDHGFTIPKNLFVVGTVNMDESTNQFSRKVLDRAMTIEMTEASFADYGKVGEPCKEDFIGNDWIAKLINRPVRVAKLVEDGDDITTAHPGLVEVQECLKKTPFAVAFRFANEYALYKLALKEFDAEDVMKCNPLDHAVLMKVLPRIVGEAEDVAEIYCGTRDPKDAKNAKEGSLLGILQEETMLSNAKMKEILGRKSTYLTFWP